MAHTGLASPLIPRAVLLCAVHVAACASAPPPAPASLPGPAPAPAPASFEGARWGTYHSKRFELSLGLPDGASWKIDDHRSPWLRATHDPTQSLLLFRSWSEDQNVTRKACYARAREWERSLPDLEAATLIDDGMRKVLGNEDARVAVGVEARAQGEGVAGFSIVIVGSVRRCTVLVYETRAQGQGAEDEVAGRLAIVAERLLPSLKIDPSFAPAREPLIGSPSAGGATGVR